MEVTQDGMPLIFIWFYVHFFIVEFLTASNWLAENLCCMVFPFLIEYLFIYFYYKKIIKKN